MDETRKNPAVLVVGPSGDGKSSMFGQNEFASIKGLPPEKTLILNSEEKVMPFDNVGDFTVKYMTNYKTLKQMLELLASDKPEALEKHGKFEYVVLDSLTSTAEMVNAWAEFAHKGFEQWKEYNAALYQIMRLIKKINKQVFVLGIPETKDIGFNDTKQYFKIKGNEHKYGGIEKEFAIVLYTMPKYDDDTGEVSDVRLQYKPNRKNSAKSPAGMFKDYPKNDAREVVLAIRNFYGASRKEETVSDTAN